MVFEGKRVNGVGFDAWTTVWPHDGTEFFSGREIVIYTPEEEASYPSHFPYWIELTPAPIEQKIRVIDSGRGLSSPRQPPR